MKKIFFLLNDTNNLFRLRKDLIEFADDKNFKIYIFCNKIGNKETIRNIRLIKTYGESNSLNPIFILFNIFIIFFQTLINKPIIIYSFTIKPNIYAILTSFFFKTKSVSTFSGLGNLYLRNKQIYKLIFKFISLFKSKNNYILFHNEKYKFFFINNFYFYKNQLSVVNGSGVDLDKDLVVKKYNKLNVLTVMRPLKEKGIEDYIKLVNHLYEKSDFNIEKVNFILVTSIDKKNKYFEKINDLLTEKKVFLVDGNENFDKYYQNCNIYLSLSKREGLSQSMIKSMHNSNIIISLNVAGCRNLIQNNINGFLIDEKDLEKKVISIFEYILNNKNKFDFKKIIKKSYVTIDKTFSKKYINNLYLKYAN